MKTVLCITVVLLLYFLTDFTQGQTLGSEIYPTEDELYEAFLIGQIDYQTYLNLQEIFLTGIDSTEMYLIEEIPNINYFQKYDSGEHSDLEEEQTRPYLSAQIGVPKDELSGSVNWKRDQKLDKSGHDRSRIYIKSQLSPNWSFKLNGNDEYLGHQEFSYRSLNYNSQRGMIRKLIIGNFTTRFGLGLTVGYRGRMFDKDYFSAEETLLFPDYGGFNGLYAEGGPRKNRVKWLLHYDKNDTTKIRSSALHLSKRYGLYRIEGTLMGSVVNNRLTQKEFRQYQIGLLLGYSGDEIEIAIEAALPKNNSNKSSKNNQAAVAEMTYKRNDFSYKFSAWYYGQNYINLFGGGRSGDLYRTVEIEAVEFDYRDRRNNQRGFLVRTSTSLSDQTNADMSLSIYGSSRYERFVEMQTSLEKTISKRTRLRIYYEMYRKEKSGQVSTENRLKLEYNYKSRQFSLKSFFGYTYENAQKQYLSQLFSLKVKNKILKEIEFWVNFGRINIETSNIDYFYCYIKEMAEITETISIAVKYRYRYNRRFSKPEESTIYLETLVVW